MVVKLVGREGPPVAVAVEPLPGPSADVDAAVSGTTSSQDDWTFQKDIEQLNIPDDASAEVENEMSFLQADLNGCFDRVSETGLSQFFAADSVSAAPSVARTSEIDRFEFPEVVSAEDVESHDSQPVFDTATALEVAARSLPMTVVEPIWEQGIWGTIFGDKNLLDVYKPFGETLKRPIDSSIEHTVDISSMPSSSRLKTVRDQGLSFMDVVRDRPDITWQEQRDSDLQSSVKFWMALVHRWYSGCSLCVSIAALGSMDRIFTMFAHLFAGRSPVTIRKRGYSVMRICDYLEGIGGVFPCNEASFYDFLCSEQQNNAPQSRMKGYMQAMNFVQHVMSMNEISDLTSSARCKGACLGEYLKERVQASPLTVSELRRIHHLLQSSDDMWLRMFCGAVLMATYCRARWGDLMRAESVIEDRDSIGMLCYLEARTGRHKTMKSQMHRHQFLPMVSPTRGVDSTNWGIVWLHVRQELGIAWPPEGLIMPAPDRQGMPTSRPLETQECAAWLRKIVGIPADNPDRRISSHSLKSTMLSYAAKRGIGIPERLQLGYHTSNFQMGMVYSRDGAAASILILERLIREIATGVFNPDETRSGRLLETLPIDAPAGESIVIEVKDEPEVVDESEPEELDSSSTSSEEPRPDFVKPTPIFQPTRAPDGFNLWQHSKLKTLHLMAIENARVFACGRTAGALHVMLKDAPLFDTPLCTNCFHRPLE
eukprot:s106_g9.t1